MSEEQKKFELISVYAKDISLEAPKVSDLFGSAAQPNLNVSFNVESKTIRENIYEVALTLTVKATHEEDTIFIIEIVQAGHFDIRGFTEKQMPEMLNVHSPGNLFPYAREAIDSLALRAGVRAITLQPINFMAVYQQQLQASQQAQQGTEH